ncbi:MAG TPA: GNAT family N-acetyltransferase [Rhizomicrobium sp.]
MTARIREGDFTRDRDLALRFIDGLQAYEYDVEPNRRLDNTVAAEHLAVLVRQAAERPGQVFVAENPDGAAIGWAVVQENQDSVYVVAAERRIAYVAELYLVDGARGSGAGRALLGACEDWARARGIGILRIGVLDGNARAKQVYAAAGFTPYAIELRKYL